MPLDLVSNSQDLRRDKGVLNGAQELRRDKGDFYVREEISAFPESSLVVGQVDNSNDSIVGFLKPNQNENKNKGALKTKIGPPPPNKPNPAIRRSPRKGTPLSAQDEPRVKVGAM